LSTAQRQIELGIKPAKIGSVEFKNAAGKTILELDRFKKSDWRAVEVIQPNGKKYVYYTPKADDVTTFISNTSSPSGKWGSRNNLLTKTQTKIDVKFGTSRAKSAGLATEERLGAMTPQQAAKQRDLPLVDAVGTPLKSSQTAKSTGKPVTTTTTKPFTTTKTTIQPMTTAAPSKQSGTKISPYVNPLKQAAPEIATKQGAKQDEQTKQTTDTATDRATDTVTETKTDTKITTTIPRITKTSRFPESTPRVAPKYPFTTYSGKGSQTEIISVPKGSVTWKQGIVWITRLPPYRQEDTLYTKKKPKGAVVTGSARTAFDTIQTISGKSPGSIPKFDMGIVDVLVTRAPQTPSHSNRAAMRFKVDPRAANRPSQPHASGQSVRNQKVGKYYVAGPMVSRKPIGKRKHHSNGYPPISHI
jgi:hypothetical protein